MTTKPLKRVLIMAGGTGGHVFPGLAVAYALQEKGIEVHWLGTAKGLEASLVPEANIPLHFIEISGLRGKGLRSLLTAPFKIIKAIRASRQVIKTLQPDVILGMGGFVSGPGGIASWLERCPLVVHEQNAKAGLTNKILALFAKAVLEGFPKAFTLQEKVHVVGNPVRKEIESLPAPTLRFDETRQKLRLLVLGGSLGAQAINEIIPATLAQLNPEERPHVLHQTGIKHYDQTKQYYEAKGIDVELKPFVKDMAAAYGWADVVLCRAGALTVSELCVAGVGAIFIPFPHAVDDHQTANANFMVKEEAALCIPQKDLTQKRLEVLIKEFSRSPKKRLAMATAAYQLRKINVTERIFDILVEVAGNNPKAF